jgi:O-antigen/teichoic acid export membrane protein
VFINSIGQIPFAALQAMSRSDLPAKLHALELPLYTAAIVVLTRAFGLRGVAVAWTLRVSFDTAMLLWLSALKLPEIRVALRAPLVLTAALLAGLFLGATLDRLGIKFAFDAVALVGFGAYCWARLLRADERTTLREWLRPSPAGAS